ncbi:unnamed protein product [Orchesella dallaii]|uniref:G-protein coupled receptors family 2 profile 2 domain-containing protein n=1 Tax=Orchesella dallaii TaxID=48710 RepID=A0ABP1QCK3_9HEXA
MTRAKKFVLIKSKFQKLLLVIFLVALVRAETSSKAKAILRRCQDFKDNRNVTSDDVLVTIPGNLTNSDETVDFGIANEVYKLPCGKAGKIKLVKWEHGEFLKPTKSKKPYERLHGSGKWSTHFTHDGYFHDEGHYYKPKDYCIQSVSEENIELRICSVVCSSKSSSKICIPKCCGVDEILVYWNFTCRKISEVINEPKWVPKVYQNPKDKEPINDPKVLDNIHIYRQKLNCDFSRWPLSDVVRPKIKNASLSDFQISWKLLNNKRPVFRGEKRHHPWPHIPEGDYCVDGFANWGFGGDGNYTGRDDHSVLLLCTSADSSHSFSLTRAILYPTVQILASLFLLATALIHLLLLDKQHLHGLTVLCHCISMFLLYVFCAIAHILSTIPNSSGGGRSKEFKVTFCWLVAILSHYFFMTTFTWLSVMNFDLWLTFRSMRPVSRMSKRVRRFWLYFAIGFGFPVILLSSFIALDITYYNDFDSEVVIPEYGKKNCFVAIWARAHYMYSLVAIALAFNTILVAWTFHIFYTFRKQNINTFSTKRAKSDKYSVRLFIKLFCVMGVGWFVELLSWKYNEEVKPWFVVGLDCVFFFLQSFAIFFIFCVNRRTLAQLTEKYPCLRRLLAPIRQRQWFKASDVDGVEMTTPGSTPRKLSLSVTANSRIDSTLPRKTSTTSVRSAGFSSHSEGNGKMENINLDSESDFGIDSQRDTVTHRPDLITNT